MPASTARVLLAALFCINPISAIPSGYGPPGPDHDACDNGGYGLYRPDHDACGNALYPNIAETAHASPQAVKLFHAHFTAKSNHNADALLATFNANEAEYLDSTLGATIAANRSELVTGQQYEAALWNRTAPDGRAYPLRILGDTVHGAVVYFVDTPQLLGAEVRTITAYDFLDGKIRRQVDNWDGRDNLVKGKFASDPQYPTTMGLTSISELAAPKIKAVANAVQTELSAGNATAAAASFSPDGVFEDLTLRARIEGRTAITSYLQRTLAQLPYGPGTKITHILGSDIGGGYEWRPAGDTVRYGITALELDCSGNITRFTTTWDGSRVTQAYIRGLAQLVPEP